ncbi:hypothetical protein [Saccharibacillus qingshengii]|uniref:hypothetical protein n=1 Tax=Saccharibacillus qingshengii TaxID=1763540 RepID=UPI001553A306|nr:hypothetical protein [Saccharibacillus qingshengii]
MKKKRMRGGLLIVLILALLGAALLYIVPDQQEQNIAAAFALHYVEEHYEDPEGLKVLETCHPFFGSGMHEVTLLDAKHNPYYLYVKIGPRRSLTSIEDSTSYIRDRDYQFGCKR